MNTETRSFEDEGLNILATSKLRDTSGLQWGERVKYALSLVETEYVLFIMEDMYLQRDADVDVIKNCVQWMSENDNVGCFNLEPLMDPCEPSDKYEGFSLIKPGIEYRLNAQPGIWRTSFLNESILPQESPWDWEVFGNKRNDVVLGNNEVYALTWGQREPFFTDLYIVKDYEKKQYKTHNGLMRGKWDVKLVRPLCKENNIQINFKNLGIYREKTLKDFLKTVVPFSWFYRIYKTIRRGKYKKLEQEYLMQSQKKYNNLVKPYIIK